MTHLDLPLLYSFQTGVTGQYGSRSADNCGHSCNRDTRIWTKVYILSDNDTGKHEDHLISFITARIRRMGKVMFSVCSHLGGGGGGGGGGSGSKVNPARGVRSKVNPATGGCQVQPGGGAIRSNQWGGGGSQHLAPSCGRYASCVHAGGLSCFFFILLAVW